MDDRSQHLNAFAQPTAALEAQIAAAEARGETVPPEAHAMLASLREIVDAMRALEASLGDPRTAEAAAEAQDLPAVPPEDTDAARDA